MDKKKSLLNVFTAIFFKIVILVLSLVVRRVLIKYIGNDINGLNSLYLSIVGFLSVADLGIGTAIAFCMYKPIVDNDVKRVTGLYNLLRKVYLIIGIIVFVLGIILIPFIKYFAKDYSEINENLHFTFFLMLISVVITYLYSSKITLFNAYKNNYIATAINSLGMILQLVLQIVFILTTKSFTYYLISRIIAALFQWGLTEIITRKQYYHIISTKNVVNKEDKKSIIKSVKAMFMHKIGGVLGITLDNIIISSFIGVVILGKYSNYTIIITAITNIIFLFFTPLTSIIGHLFAEQKLDELKKYYNFLYIFNFILAIVFYIGYYAVIDDLIYICFGDGLLLNKYVSFVLASNYFVYFLRQTTEMYKDASGVFYYDRWKPLFEGTFNAVLSIILVVVLKKYYGDEIAVIGAVAATILANLTICHIVEPHVVHKYGLKMSAKKYYLKNYCCIIVFFISISLFNIFKLNIDNHYLSFLANGFLSLVFSIIPSIIIGFIDKDFRFYFKKIVNKIAYKIIKNK